MAVSEPPLGFAADAFAADAGFAPVTGLAATGLATAAFDEAGFAPALLRTAVFGEPTCEKLRRWNTRVSKRMRYRISY